MGEVVTSRFSEELVKKVDRAVLRGRFRSRSEALRAMIEEYLIEHPEVFLGDGTEELLAESPTLPDDQLESLGSRLFRGLNVARIVAEGRG